MSHDGPNVERMVPMLGSAKTDAVEFSHQNGYIVTFRNIVLSTEHCSAYQ
jgi:hypothetical protein